MPVSRSNHGLSIKVISFRLECLDPLRLTLCSSAAFSSSSPAGSLLTRKPARVSTSGHYVLQSTNQVPHVAYASPDAELSELLSPPCSVGRAGGTSMEKRP